MTDVRNLFESALKHHQAGHIRIAEQLYNNILQKQPNHEEAIHLLGLIRFQEGDYLKAIALITRAVEIDPLFVAAHYNLGRCYEQLAENENAVQSYSKALSLKPDDADCYLGLGNVQLELLRFEEALGNFERAIELNPKFAEAYSNRGNALNELKRLDEALMSYDRAISLGPDYAEAHIGRGNVLSELKRLDEALVSYDRAISLKPDYAEAHSNRGNVLTALNRLDEALMSHDRAISLKPDYAEAHSNRGNVLNALKRLDEALMSYDKAISFKPDCAEAHSNRGNVLKNLMLFDDAIASYRKALQFKPDCVGAFNILCELYEKQNKLNDLEETLEKAILSCGWGSSELLYRHAQLASRRKKFGEALDYLGKVQVDKLQPSLKPEYFSLLGKAYDNVGRFDEAFSAFEAQNEITSASVEVEKIDADGFLKSIQSRKRAWTTSIEPSWSGTLIGAKQTSPAFLIGFPRSGTTLLDTILRSHSGIGVVEEEPMVRETCEAFGQVQTIQNLNALPEAGVHRLREVYFKALHKYCDPNSDKLVVDKLPLNIVHVGIIHRIFPDAKFILVLRHPCDCVLSCFMQTFSINNAMANFITLQQSARLYAAVMELWSLQRKKLQLDVHVLKYEDLVGDLEGTCRPLLRFLGLQWEDNLRNYQATAMERSIIYTPSYNQVIQPLYKEACGRWTHYRMQMQPALPLLQPWIEAFDY